MTIPWNGWPTLATLEDFEKIGVRVGVVTEITPFPGGKYSTHILMIDFEEELGVKKSLARLAPIRGA